MHAQAPVKVNKRQIISATWLTKETISIAIFFHDPLFSNSPLPSHSFYT